MTDNEDIPASMQDIVELQGRISAMVIKDQQDDRILEQVPRIVASIRESGAAIGKQIEDIKFQLSVLSEHSRSVSDMVNVHAERINLVAEISAVLSDITSRMAEDRQCLDENIDRTSKLSSGLDSFTSRMESQLAANSNTIRSLEEFKNAIQGSEIIRKKSISDLSNKIGSVECDIIKNEVRLDAVVTEVKSIRDDLDKFKQSIADDLLQFKTSVAAALSKALEDQRAITDTKLAALQASIDASKIKEANIRIDALEVDRGIANKKFDLNERQIIAFTRQLDAFSVALKGLQLDKG